MLKLSKKIIAPFLSYTIFLRGLFFMPHPVDRQKTFRVMSLWTGTCQSSVIWWWTLRASRCLPPASTLHASNGLRQSVWNVSTWNELHSATYVIMFLCFSAYFEKKSEFHPYNTHTKEELHFKLFHSSLCQRSLKYKGIYFEHSLPEKH